MRASVVVAIFYLAAGIAPSFAAPALLASDLAKIKETASYALQHSSSTASDSTSTNEESTTTSNSGNADESDSTNSASTEETTTKPGSGGTNTPETTTPTTEANPAATGSSTSKWRVPQQMTEQAILQLTSGLIASAMTGVINRRTHRDVLERFEARIDHELVARARQDRREGLTMLLADLD